MKTVTSVSGGKTSAMMAVEHPTDYYVFACVLTDQIEVAPKDKGLLRAIQEKLPQFKASRELDQTLKNLLELEQLIGKSIDWVASEFTYDELIQKTKRLPNPLVRTCTEYLKLDPIFWYCYLNYYDGDPLLMNIGFRLDESPRVERMGDCKYSKYKFPKQCNFDRGGQQQWDEVEWRIPRFPLWESRIDKLDVAKYWLEKGWSFPSVSNCDFCFHHRPIQQQTQANYYPERANWWIEQEKVMNKTFAKIPLEKILSQQVLDIYDDVFDCNCTD